MTPPVTSPASSHTTCRYTLVAVLFSLASVAHAQSPMRFECRATYARAAAMRLSAASVYPEASAAPPSTLPLSATPAFGFDLQTLPSTFSNGACSSTRPFFFSVFLPDGNYKVTLVLGAAEASTTTVRAESRRLFLLQQHVAAGASTSQEFIVNVRTAGILSKDAAATPQKVKLKAREIGALDWDDKLTIEFNGEHPAFRAITITPVTNIPTLYLAGDSTVVDQDKEPWAAWGQMLPVFFTARLAISNQAESGETIRSFVGERRFDKIFSTLKAGDSLMMQFAHNDQKTGGGFVSLPDYKDLLRRYIALARDKGATPILVTSMNRRSFDPSGHINQTLGGYPDAMREVAAEQHVALIDLNALSKTLFEAMGEQGTLSAFVHYPPNTFPGQTAELKDDTHFNAYGAYELARAIVQNLRDQHLPLAADLRPGIAPFDPAHPDSLAAWHLPPSPAISTETPYGR